MKKLLLTLSTLTLSTFPIITTVSCGVITKPVSLDFSGINVKKYKFDKEKKVYIENGTSDKDILSSLNGIRGNHYNELISNILNVLSYDITVDREHEVAFNTLKGKDKNTSIVGQYRAHPNDGKSEKEYYDRYKNTHISSFKGLLELKNFFNKNNEITSDTLKNDLNLLNDKKVENVLNTYINSKHDNYVNKVTLSSKVTSSDNEILLAECNNTLDFKDMKEKMSFDYIESNGIKPIIPNVIKTDTSKFADNKVIGTLPSDLFGITLLGEKENIPNIKSTNQIEIVNEKKEKDKKENINLFEKDKNNESKKMIISLTKDKDDKSKKSSYKKDDYDNYYYINTDENYDLKLNINFHNSEKNTDESLDITIGGLYKKFIPTIGEISSLKDEFKNDDSRKGEAGKEKNKAFSDYIFGWLFNNYQFSKDNNNDGIFKEIFIKELKVK